MSRTTLVKAGIVAATLAAGGAVAGIAGAAAAPSSTSGTASTTQTTPTTPSTTTGPGPGTGTPGSGPSGHHCPHMGSKSSSGGNSGTGFPGGPPPAAHEHVRTGRRGSTLPPSPPVHTSAAGPSQPTRVSRLSSPESVWLEAASMRTPVSSPGAASPAKLTTLLWRVRPRRRSGSVRQGPRRAPRRCGRRTAGRARGPALDELDEALHARNLDRVRHETLRDGGRLGAAAGREEEREGPVVADCLDDLEGSLEVLLGLAGKADDDVGRERQRRGRARGSSRRGRGSARGRRCGASPAGSARSPTAAAGGCARRRSRSSAWARITSSRMSFGCGLV